MNEEKYFSMMQSKFTYDHLMEWDKNELVEELLGKQSDIEYLLKCVEKLMKKNEEWWKY